MPTWVPTSSTSSPASTCSWASPSRRSTSWSRCSRSRTTSRPAGSGSIPTCPAPGQPALRAAGGGQDVSGPPDPLRAPWRIGTSCRASSARAVWARSSAPTRPIKVAARTNQRVRPATSQVGRHFPHGRIFIFGTGLHPHFPAAQARALMTRPIPRPGPSCAKGGGRVPVSEPVPKHQTTADYWGQHPVV